MLFFPLKQTINADAKTMFPIMGQTLKKKIISNSKMGGGIPNLLKSPKFEEQDKAAD